MSDDSGEITIAGPQWRMPNGLAGTAWSVPAGLRCPYCEDRPKLTYYQHAIYCRRCDHRFEPIAVGDADQFATCRTCRRVMVRDGPIVYCRIDNDFSHPYTAFILSTPIPPPPCRDCGGPCDLDGTGRLCRRCVLTSYLSIRFDELVPRWLLSAKGQDRFIEAVGFHPDAPITGVTHTEGGYLLGDLATPRVDRPPGLYLPAIGQWKEHYAVKTPSPYQAGQMASSQGEVFLYRVYDASGMEYEAALPAGTIAATDSVKVETPKRVSRRDPYPDRVINGPRLPRKAVNEFRQVARRWLANDPSNPGRSEGSTYITQDDWPAKYAGALQSLQEENTKPSPALIAHKLGIGERTLRRYKRKWGDPTKNGH